MNKRFSTLMASLLFASAFTVNAANPPVEGDYVRLGVSDKVVSIDNKGALTTETVTAALAAGTASADDYEAYFKNANTQLWKIAKITKAATTGAETYQFINKQTGEYLAIKLVTDKKDHTSESAAKLDPAGNKDWAFENDKLYYYDAKQDSTFYLENNGGDLKLTSKPGKDVKNATKVKITDLSLDPGMTLDANAFNVLMSLNGNDGRLHFNGKDVSEKETNILKNTKWTAVQFASGSSAFALTDGSKSASGYADDLGFVDDNEEKGYIKNVKKVNYLMVDTNYYDASSKYFVLTKDTVPYEWTAEKFFGGRNAKKANTRTANAAQMTGKYFLANDSIVLKASYVPKLEQVASAGTLVPSEFGEQAVPDADDALAVAAGDVNSLAALNNFLAAVAKFAETAPAATASAQTFDAANVTIEVEGQNVTKTGAQWRDAMDQEITESLRLSQLYTGSAYQWKAGTPENGVLNAEKKKEIDDYFTALGDLVNSNANLGTLKKAWNSYKEVNNESAENKIGFAGAKFDDGNDYAYTTEDRTWTGSVLLNQVQINNTWSDAQLNAFSSLRSALTAVEIPVSGYKDLTNADLVTPDATTVNAFVTILEATYGPDEDLKNAINALADAVDAFAEMTNSDTENAKTFTDVEGNQALIDDVVAENGGAEVSNAVATYVENVRQLSIPEAEIEDGNMVPGKNFFNGKADVTYETSKDGQVVLRKLSSATVLTITNDGAVSVEKPNGYILPLVQPYATAGGDAKIATTNFHFIKVKNEGKVNAPSLRATEADIETNKYWIVDWKTEKAVASTEVSEANPYTQWAFVEGSTGSYSIINRATEKVMYTGPLFKVADAENTFTNGIDTLQLSAVEIPESAVITEGDQKYDVSGAFYPGKDETLIKRLFAISPVSPFMSQLNAQFNKDSVMILGDAEDAPVWQLAEVSKSKKTYGYTIEGIAPLLKAEYNIYTKDGDDNVYYVVLNEKKNGYVLTKSTSKAGATPAAFTFLAVAENQYLIKDAVRKMTINPTPAKPILEASNPTSERNDLFTFTQVNQNLYRTLTDEDGVLGNAKIYMENEPNRFLYENTANIVANNGTGYNFLGIYNTAELTKNAALYVDTAYVNRENNLMPQYMFALGVETVDAQDAVACTYEHNHFDNAGNKVDALHCSHATPATLGYKSGRYLVALNDSTPENGSKNHPTYFDNAVRLAFVPAIHRNAENSLIIKDSKWTDNSKQIKAGEAKTYASKDTMEIADQALNPATFALLIKDQATKSFYLQNGNGYVRILNGVPVLTASTKDAAVFNIAATTEEATANEAIEAATVQVIAGKGVVTVQGAAGKVITVANILGQTIANQVAASDNVTIAAPAGVLVVTVDGEATKVVVK